MDGWMDEQMDGRWTGKWMVDGPRIFKRIVLEEALLALTKRDVDCLK